MLENLVVWLIIGAAALYAGRNIYRIFSGKAKGCTCEKGCEPPSLQQDIPDLKKPSSKSKP
ncbi:MAG: FeoB-associated Cys-rich membrane protein [Desulfobulbaceae bacterium]|nr:FeoB-associated Cys-rich membrane protein [Desulfobulbaceae bacterium]